MRHRLWKFLDNWTFYDRFRFMWLWLALSILYFLVIQIWPFHINLRFYRRYFIVCRSYWNGLWPRWLCIFNWPFCNCFNLLFKRTNWRQNIQSLYLYLFAGFLCFCSFRFFVYFIFSLSLLIFILLCFSCKDIIRSLITDWIILLMNLFIVQRLKRALFFDLLVSYFLFNLLFN